MRIADGVSGRRDPPKATGRKGAETTGKRKGGCLIETDVIRPMTGRFPPGVRSAKQGA